MRVALGLGVVALVAARAGAGTVTVLDATGDVGA